MKLTYYLFKSFRCCTTGSASGFTLLSFLFLTLTVGPSLAAQNDPAVAVTLFRENTSVALRQQVLDREPDLTTFSLLTLDEAVAADLQRTRPTALEVPLPGGGSADPLVLKLERFEVLAPDFEVVEMPAGRVITDLPESVFYRGEVSGLPGSVAIVSLIDGKVSGLLSLPGESGEHNLVQLEGEDTYLLYDDAEIKSKFTDTECETRLPEGVVPDDKSTFDPPPSKQVDGCFGIYFDIGEEIYNERGGTAGAVSFFEAAFAQVATLFKNEEISVTISGTRVWTSREPFYNDLDKYRTYRKANNVNGSLAHYVHRAGGGGLAYVNVLCSKDYGYGLSGINNDYRALPNFSWTVFVLAHELGHNFSSPHTHECAWNGNNTPIDGCGGATDKCNIPTPFPTDGGTVMSYCHLQTTGVNFSKGFGDQPGDRIRAAANRAGCKGFDCGNGGGGGGNGGGGGGGNDDVALADGAYYLYARHSNKVVRVSNASFDNGAPIVQYTYNAWGSQRWDVQQLGNGVYRLTNVRSGKALDVNGASTDNLARIIQWNYGGGQNQQWKLEDLGGDYYHVRAVHSNKCLNVGGNATNDDAALIQWPCGSGTNDDFRFVPATAGLDTEEGDAGVALTVHPNPTRGEVHLSLALNQEFGEGHFTVSDTRGRTLQVGTFAAEAGQHLLDLDLSRQSAGIYLVRIDIGKQVLTRRIVVTR